MFGHSQKLSCFRLPPSSLGRYGYGYGSSTETNARYILVNVMVSIRIRRWWVFMTPRSTHTYDWKVRGILGFEKLDFNVLYLHCHTKRLSSLRSRCQKLRDFHRRRARSWVLSSRRFMMRFRRLLRRLLGMRKWPFLFLNDFFDGWFLESIPKSVPCGFGKREFA